MPAPATAAVKTVSLCDSPHCHEPAITPPGHAETVGIDWIFFNCGIDPGEIVAQIAAAEILHVCAGEFFALAVTAARIWKQHDNSRATESAAIIARDIPDDAGHSEVVRLDGPP